MWNFTYSLVTNNMNLEFQPNESNTGDDQAIKEETELQCSTNKRVTELKVQLRNHLVTQAINDREA